MKKFLTTAPLIKKIRSGEWEELAIAGDASPLALNYIIKCTRKAGTVQSYTQAVSMTGKRMKYIVSLPSGETFSLLSKMETYITIYNTETHVYDIVTETRVFSIDETARKNPTRIGWLNTLGGIDYYTFTGAKASEAIADRSEFVRDLPIDFTVQDRSASVLTSAYREEFEIVSDYESEDTYRWLSSVFASPEVWVIESGVVIPINLVNAGIIITSDDLIQAKIKYRKSNSLIAQNG